MYRIKIGYSFALTLAIILASVQTVFSQDDIKLSYEGMYTNGLNLMGMEIKWEYSGDVNIFEPNCGFEVKRQDVGGEEWTTINGVGPDSVGQGKYSILDARVPAGEYVYSIRKDGEPILFHVTAPSASRFQASDDYIWRGENITLIINDPIFRVNGKVDYIYNDRTTAPLLKKNGFTYIPIRAVVEAMNNAQDGEKDTDKYVKWDGTEEKITLSFLDMSAELKVGSNEIKITQNQEKTRTEEMSSAPYMSGERVLVPVRALECLSCDINWDATYRKVTVSYPSSVK